MSLSEEKAKDAARSKDYDRDSRLSRQKKEEYRLRCELAEIAHEKCAQQFHDVHICAKENGFMAVWSCRKLLKRVEKCLELHNGEEAWQKFKAEREADIDKKERDWK